MVLTLPAFGLPTILLVGWVVAVSVALLVRSSCRRRAYRRLELVVVAGKRSFDALGDSALLTKKSRCFRSPRRGSS
jgi:hypothetical protein